MIARACGLPENSVYIEDINEDVSLTNPYIVPKDVNTLIRHSVMPDDPLKYTFTWFQFQGKEGMNSRIHSTLAEAAGQNSSRSRGKLHQQQGRREEERTSRLIL